MTRELAWKPRWATIRLVNSWASSTLDISSVPALERAAAAGAGQADQGGTRAAVDPVAVVARLQRDRPGLFEQLARPSWAEGLAAAVREHAREHAVVADGEGPERTARAAVLAVRRRRRRHRRTAWSASPPPGSAEVDGEGPSAAAPPGGVNVKLGGVGRRQRAGPCSGSNVMVSRAELVAARDRGRSSSTRWRRSWRTRSDQALRRADGVDDVDGVLGTGALDLGGVGRRVAAEAAPRRRDRCDGAARPGSGCRSTVRWW